MLGASSQNEYFLLLVRLEAEWIVIHICCDATAFKLSKLLLYTSVIILMVWLHRDRHRALRSRIHQPLLLDSQECHVPATCSTTQGDKRQRLCQNGHVLRVRLPGHAKDRSGEFFPSLSLSDPDKLRQAPGMPGIICKSHFHYLIQTFIIVTERKLLFFWCSAVLHLNSAAFSWVQ